MGGTAGERADERGARLGRPRRLDEISIAGESRVAAVENGKVTTFTITPEDAGLRRHPIEEIKGGDAAHNAEALRAVLSGAANAHRDTVVLNAAAALVVAGKARTVTEGVALARASIDEGRARQRLERLIAVSNG